MNMNFYQTCSLSTIQVPWTVWPFLVVKSFAFRKKFMKTKGRNALCDKKIQLRKSWSENPEGWPYSTLFNTKLFSKGNGLPIPCTSHCSLSFIHNKNTNDASANTVQNWPTVVMGFPSFSALHGFSKLI